MVAKDRIAVTDQSVVFAKCANVHPDQMHGSLGRH